MHVITKGSDGSVCKWSILQGVKVQTFPANTDYDSVVRGVGSAKFESMCGFCKRRVLTRTLADTHIGYRGLDAPGRGAFEGRESSVQVV